MGISVENFTLSDGRQIPGLGLGTYAGENLEHVVKAGIDIGYRLIDTAFYYKNEVAIGKGLKAAIQEGRVNREDIFIVSKLWNNKHRPTEVLPSIKRSLQDLQLEYLDLYLIHWPFAVTPTEDEYEFSDSHEDTSVTIEDTWRAMEELVKQGYTRSIGLANFNSHQIERVLEISTIKPVVNQVECNPYFSQEKLRVFCKQKDILIMAYSPLYAVGRMSSNNDGLNLLKEPLIEELAQKYKKSAAQIVLRYLVQCKTVPIPKTDKLDHLKSNLDVYDFFIIPEDFEKLRSLNRNERCTDFPRAKHFKEYPFNCEF